MRRESETCTYWSELIAYLYGELSADERSEFEKHLLACAICREELSGFERTRAFVRTWKARAEEAAVGLPAISLGSAPNQPQWRQALAALREFFALSPAWLRVTSAVATLVVCALAALAVAHAELHVSSEGVAFRTGIFKRPPAQTKAASSEPLYTQEEMERIVAERIAAARAQMLDRIQSEQLAIREQAQSMPHPSPAQASAQQPDFEHRVRRSEQAAVALARDDDAPRLSDLLSEISD